MKLALQFHEKRRQELGVKYSTACVSSEDSYCSWLHKRYYRYDLGSNCSVSLRRQKITKNGFFRELRLRYKDARDKVKELKVSGTSKDDVSAMFVNMNKK